MAKRNKKNHEDCWNKIGVWSTSPEKCERLLQVIHCRNCDIFSKAGREVLERNAPGGYVTQWQKEIAHQKQEISELTHGVMMFRIGNEWFAISAGSLQEIAELRKIHNVPHNENPNIRGVVNIGGEVDICYSLANLLEITKHEDGEGNYQRLMVISYQAERYIFPVSEVRGMIHYGESDVLTAPSTLGPKKSSLINGIFMVDKNSVAILDADQICRTLGGLAA